MQAKFKAKEREWNVFEDPITNQKETSESMQMHFEKNPRNTRRLKCE